eukprot:scaffold118670_cov37-Cyclotella_meneghiniana.AAC.5
MSSGLAGCWWPAHYPAVRFGWIVGVKHPRQNSFIFGRAFSAKFSPDTQRNQFSLSSFSSHRDQHTIIPCPNYTAQRLTTQSNTYKAKVIWERVAKKQNDRANQ